MSCIPLRRKDGSVVYALVKPGAKLTEKDKKVLEEYAEFCRERKMGRERKEQQQRNRRQR